MERVLCLEETNEVSNSNLVLVNVLMLCTICFLRKKNGERSVDAGGQAGVLLADLLKVFNINY